MADQHNAKHKAHIALQEQLLTVRNNFDKMLTQIKANHENEELRLKHKINILAAEYKRCQAGGSSRQENRICSEVQQKLVASHQSLREVKRSNYAETEKLSLQYRRQSSSLSNQVNKSRTALLILRNSLNKCRKSPGDVFNIDQELSRIEGLTSYTELPSPIPNYRVFEMRFIQPVEHEVSAGPTFQQRLILWHRDVSRPMVLQTSGYEIFGLGLSALASEFSANQIQVEHRFFGSSTPQELNWKHLNIKESAADFHRITQAFKRIYKAAWVNTGRSKGGMTSVYHRKFFPNDVDATVAHVAPHSFSVEDSRYADFLSHRIGGEEHKECRRKLADIQVNLLRNRDNILPKISDGEFSLLGSKAVAFEHAVVKLPWAFWQFRGPSSACSNVPSHDSSLDTQVNFLFGLSSPYSYSDIALSNRHPYFYQAATQLGHPGTHLDPLRDLLNFEGTLNVFSYIPPGTQAIYDDAAAMSEVSQWIQEESERMIYIYGEYDPWTAGAFVPRSEGDSYLFTVPGFNHGAQLIDLEGESRDLAYQKLRSWLGIQDEKFLESVLDSIPNQKTLEQIEFEALMPRPRK